MKGKYKAAIALLLLFILAADAADDARPVGTDARRDLAARRDAYRL
jgi:hypothetical protein